MEFTISIGVGYAFNRIEAHREECTYCIGLICLTERQRQIDRRTETDSDRKNVEKRHLYIVVAL